MNILVVGAGIAGPTLAFWLLRGGHQPTLVEQSPSLRRGGYLIDFWGAGFEVADRMAIVPELVRRGYRAREVQQVDGNGKCVTSFSPEMIVGPLARYVSVRRTDLADVIYDALGGQVETLFDDTVSELRDDGARVRVTFEKSGATRDFDLVVGADGLHSQVRRLAFGPDERFEKYLGFKVAAFDIMGYRPRTELVARMYTQVGFQVTAFPMAEDATMFALTFRDDDPQVPASREAQEALVRARFAGAGWETPSILGQMSASRALYVDRVSQIRMPSWTRGRVTLVGDAGACPSLLAGQGSALAMVGAYVLAAELARAPDVTEALRRYQRALAPFLLSKQRAAERLAGAFAPKNRFQLFLRNSVMRLMSLPLVARLATGNSFRDAIELPPPPGAA